MSCKLINIRKCFGEQVVFDHMSVEFEQAGFYLLYGKSGSGKTTLLNMLAGYEGFEEGNREVDVQTIACIFQSFELLPTLSVKENIELYEKLHDVVHPNKEEILKKLKIQSLLSHYPEECSQGQQQRIAIARALLMDPDIILCDEPTESLDHGNKEMVMELLMELAKTKIVIVASHELAFIKQYDPILCEVQNHSVQMHVQKKQHCCSFATTHHEHVNQAYLQQLIKALPTFKQKIGRGCLWVLALVVLLLMQGYATLFVVANTSNVLNPNEIYLHVESQGYVEIPKGAQPLLEFEDVQYLGKNYRMNIVPALGNEQGLPIEGKEPTGFQVLVNQNVAELLQDETVIGSTISCNYRILGMKFPIDFTVSGIIQEEDAKDAYQIYYHKTDLEQWLAQQPCMEGEDGTMKSQYEVMEEETDFYGIHKASLEESAETYEQLQKAGGYRVSSVLMDQRIAQANERTLYETVFLCALVLLVLLQLLYTWYEEHSTFTNLLPAYAILYACQTPLLLLQTYYLKEKQKTATVFAFLLMLLSIFYVVLFEKPLGILLVFVGYGVCFLLWYQLVVWIQSKKLQEKKIAHILKEEKDQR